MVTKPGKTRIGVNIPYEQIFKFDTCAGQVATNGVGYSTVVTFGTTALEILNEMIKPGFSAQLQKLGVGLTQKFANLISTNVGSLIYRWEAREEYIDPGGTAGPHLITSAWVPVSPTFSKGIGSLLTSEDTLSNWFPVATLSHIPLRLRLIAQGLVAASMTGQVKNSSYIEAVGNVIPGT